MLKADRHLVPGMRAVSDVAVMLIVGATVTVLIVNDTQEIIDLLSELFDEEGYRMSSMSVPSWHGLCMRRT